MRHFPWNTCTSFAAIGAALALLILIPAFGLHWQLIPGGIAGLALAYAVSTGLGSWFARIHMAHRAGLVRLGAGIGAALLTLLGATLALTVANFLLAMGIDMTNAPSGQPFWNAAAERAPQHAQQFVLKPLRAGLIFGQVPAFILGAVYGVFLGPASPNEHLSTSKAPTSAYLASGIGVALSLVLAGFTAIQANRTRTPVPGGVPMAFRGCSYPLAPEGAAAVLAYCRGSPCESGYCDWDTQIDAIAMYVSGPQGNQWRYTGGGIGHTNALHILQHHTHWVRPGPDGNFGESNPRRHVGFELRLDDTNIHFLGRTFAFTPGMLLVARCSDDWSCTGGVGQAALAETDVTVRQLQQSLDDACAMLAGCDRGFQIIE